MQKESDCRQTQTISSAMNEAEESFGSVQWLLFKSYQGDSDSGWQETEKRQCPKTTQDEDRNISSQITAKYIDYLTLINKLKEQTMEKLLPFLLEELDWWIQPDPTRPKYQFKLTISFNNKRLNYRRLPINPAHPLKQSIVLQQP